MRAWTQNKHLKVHGVYEAANVRDVIHLCRTMLCKTPKNGIGNGEAATILAFSRITPFLLASQRAFVSQGQPVPPALPLFVHGVSVVL